MPPKAPGATTFALPVCNVDEAKKDIKDARLQLAEVNLSSVKLLISNAQIAATEIKSTKSKFDKLYDDTLKKKTEFNKYKEQRKQYTDVLDPDIASSEEQTLKYMNNIEEAKVVMEDLVNRALKAASLAEESGSSALEYADKANKAINDAEQAIKAGGGCAIAKYASELSQHVVTLDTALKINTENAITSAMEIVKYFDGLNKQATVVKTSVASFTTKTIDPPIASVGQNVQFIVNYGGNVTPTWNFVRFKGPNAPLFGAQGMRTHFLNISLGPSAPPSPGGQKGAPGLARGPGLAVQQSQLNLLLTTLFPARPF